MRLRQSFLKSGHQVTCFRVRCINIWKQRHRPYPTPLDSASLGVKPPSLHLLRLSRWACTSKLERTGGSQWSSMLVFLDPDSWKHLPVYGAPHHIQAVSLSKVTETAPPEERILLNLQIGKAITMLLNPLFFIYTKGICVLCLSLDISLPIIFSLVKNMQRIKKQINSGFGSSEIPITHPIPFFCLLNM